MSQAISLGMTRYMLYSMLDKGILEKVTRGVYRLKELEPLSNPDLVTIAVRFPKAVVCLISALAFHEITTQVPHEVAVAVPKDSRTIKLQSPPVVTHKFSKESYQEGIERHMIDDTTVQVYSPEKTLADCFKFRNKIGMDIFFETLKLYRSKCKPKIGEILRYSRVCRVESSIKPYLESNLI